MVAAAEDEIAFELLDTDAFKLQTRRIKEILAPVIDDFSEVNMVSAVRIDPMHLSLAFCRTGEPYRIFATATLFWCDEHRWSEEDVVRATWGYAQSLVRIGGVENVVARVPIWRPDDPARVRPMVGAQIGSIELHDMHTTVRRPQLDI